MEQGARSLARLGGQRAGSRDFGQLRRLAAYLRPYRGHVVGALLALIIASAAVLSLGRGPASSDRRRLQRPPAGALNHAIEAVAIVIPALAVATYLRSYLVTWLGERVVADLRRDVYGHVLRLSPGFFEVTRTGEVLSRLATDTSVIQTVIGSSATQALRNLLLVLGGVVLLVVTNPRLTGFVLVVVPLVVVPIVVIGRRVRRLSRAAQDRMADVTGAAEETINAIRTVQSFAQEDREASRFSAATEAAFTAATGYARSRAMLGAIIIALVFGSIAGVLWLGGHDVLTGRITAGELSAFVFYATVVASAFGGLSDVFGDLQRAAGATERLFELLDAPAEITAPGPSDALPAHSPGALRFEQVSFAYPSHPERLVLEASTSTVRPGETLALVGPSGAGKTSVFQLLMRYYDPNSRPDPVRRVPITRSSRGHTAARIGLVPQEPVIFSADAWSNIRYGRPEASEAEVRAAAEAAAASEFSIACRTDSPPSSARRACACRAGSGSGSPSPAPSCATRPCCCWTRRRAPSTPRTSVWCNLRSSG